MKVNPVLFAKAIAYEIRQKIMTECCCSTDGSLYPADLLANLPEGESTVSHGCGDPIALASL